MKEKMDKQQKQNAKLEKKIQYHANKILKAAIKLKLPEIEKFVEGTLENLTISKAQNYTGMKEREPIKRIGTNKDNDIVLDYYITKEDKPILIHTPAVFGIREKLKKYDAEPTVLQFRPQADPAEILGKTVYNNGTPTYVPPTWFTQLVAKCEAEPDKKHILLIDDVTQGTPAVQSTIYELILNKAIDISLANTKLPDNCVLVLNDIDSMYYYPLPKPIVEQLEQVYYEDERDLEETEKE